MIVETPTNAPGSDATPGAPVDRLRHISAPARKTAYAPRYSRLVRSLRVILPVTGVLAIAIVILWPKIRAQFNRPTQTSRDERQAKMVNGRYVGSDSHGRPYTVTYESAEQPPDGGPINMVDPIAELTLRNGHWVAVSAKNGRYDQAGGTLDLAGDVEVFHDDGYNFVTDRAHVEFAKNIISGDRSVSGRGPKGEVEGRGFLILNNGESIIFTGPAHILLRPDAARLPEPAVVAGANR